MSSVHGHSSGFRSAPSQGNIGAPSGDLRRDLNDGNKRLNDLEDTYWSHRDKDAHARDERIKAVGDKLAMVERQVTDYSHELKEVQRDLRRAADLNRRIHDMEMRQDERRIREQEAKRGPKGATGERGPQGERGAAGKDGRDGHSVVLKTKNWETNDKKFLARETLSDGTRMPAINLRPMFEYFLGEIDQRYEQMIADALRRSSHA